MCDGNVSGTLVNARRRTALRSANRNWFSVPLKPPFLDIEEEEEGDKGGHVVLTDEGYPEYMSF